MLGLHAGWLFSEVAVGGGHSLAAVRRLCGGGFSCCGAQVTDVHFSSCSSWVPQHRLNSCTARSYTLQGVWDLPISRDKPITTEPPGKPAAFINWSPYFTQATLSFYVIFFLFRIPTIIPLHLVNKSPQAFLGWFLLSQLYSDFLCDDLNSSEEFWSDIFIDCPTTGICLMFFS